MRISDWSSDVCSSDLARGAPRNISKVHVFHHGIEIRPFDSLQIGQIIDQFHQVAPGRGYIAGVIGIIATERTLQLTTDGISVCNDSAERLAQRPVQTLAEHRSEEHTSELQSLM